MLLRGLLIAIALVGCSPVLSSPAPTPDLANRYIHPGGVFSLELPPSWSAGDLSEGPALLVMFAPPGGDRPLLTVYAVREDASLDEAAFREAMDTYLEAAYNDTLTVLDRAAMGDGSWRVTGIRHTRGEALPVNIFMQRDGAFFSALEVIVPRSDPSTMALLTVMVNSYRVNDAAEWPVGNVADVPQPPADLILTAGNLRFSGLFSWTDERGRFHVSGRLANRAPYPLQDITIGAALHDSSGRVVAEQVGAAPAAVLLDGEYTPFDVRFEEGRPSDAERLALRAGAQRADAALLDYYGPEFFEWEDRAEYDESGRLHIRGTVWNVGTETAHHVQVLVTLFDAADRVVGYAAADVEDGPLAPDASARFDVPAPPAGAEPARYLVTIQASRRP